MAAVIVAESRPTPTTNGEINTHSLPGKGWAQVTKLLTLAAFWHRHNCGDWWQTSVSSVKDPTEFPGHLSPPAQSVQMCH